MFMLNKTLSVCIVVFVVYVQNVIMYFVLILFVVDIFWFCILYRIVIISINGKTHKPRS